MMSRTYRAAALLLLVALCVCAEAAQGSSPKPVPATTAAKSNATESSSTSEDTKAGDQEGQEVAYQVLVFNNSRPAVPANIPKAVQQMKQALADYFFRAESVDQVTLHHADFNKTTAEAVFKATGPTAQGGAADVLTNCQGSYMLLFNEYANAALELRKAIQLLWPGQSVTVIKKSPQCSAKPK